MRTPSFGRRATLLATGAALTLGLSGCEGLCTGIPFLDAFFCAYNEAPVARLSASPNPVVSGRPVTLDAAASEDYDGTIRYYSFNTGDPLDTLRIEPRTTHVYTLPNGGTVHPSVTVGDDEGASDTATVDLQVVPAGPNGQPLASIAVFPAAPDTSDYVEFTGTWSDDGQIVRAEWDLDGNGSFEVSTAISAFDRDSFQYRRFTTPGDHNVAFRVTDDRGGQGTAAVTVHVVAANQPPVAALTVSPNPASADQLVTFDASGSVDPDGTITQYRFDLTPVVGFETDNGNNPVAMSAYGNGCYTVGVRVFDDDGATADVYRQLEVGPGSCSARATAAKRKHKRRKVRFSAGLTAVPAVGTDVKVERRGKVRRVRDVAATGRFNGKLAKKGRKRAPRSLRALLRARFRGSITAAVNTKSQKRRVRITAVARLRRGTRSCLRITLTDAPRRAPRGTFRTLGGTRAGKRLRARGRFHFVAGKGAATRIKGTVRARSTRPRTLPAACRAILHG